MMRTIQLIQPGSTEYEEMIRLRVQVLLQPIGVPESYIDREKEKDHLMVGAYEEAQLIGCCVLTPHHAELIQLRQMAVHTDWQGKGVGAAIVRFAEETARSRGYRTLMLHARDVVIPFYQKSGYVIAGPPFTEVGIGHHRMEKQL